MSRPPPDAGAGSIARLYGAVWRHARGARLTLAASASLLVGSQLLKLLVPWLAGQAINALQLGGAQSARSAAGWVGLVLLTYCGVWLLHGPGRVLERGVGVRVRRSVSDALYDKLMRAPLGWHEQRHSGDVQHRMGQASAALYGFTQNQYVYLQNAVNLVGPVAALLLLSVVAGAVAVVGYAVVAVVIVRFDAALMRLAVQENAAERRYAAGLLDFLGNVGTVMSLRLAAATRRLLGRRLDAVFAPLKRSIVLNEAKWCAVDLLSVALTWGLVAVYVWHTRASGAALLLGSVFMVYQYAQQAGGVIGSLAANFQSFARTRTDFASADPIWQAPERPAPAGAVAPAWREIALRGLGFAHPAAGAGERGGGVHEVSFALHRGERIALVGASGSGKSTLLRVLAGLYEAQQGAVAVDGAVVPGLRDLAAEATLIPQEAEVFEATVAENIAFGEPAAPEALAFAAHCAAFDVVLGLLPQGLDTPLTERGMNLSGGQRQRLCLVRGVHAARGRSVLLLDEPTSALDPLTEAWVHERLHAGFPGACIVASVHRLSLLAHFDTVVLMAAGRVVDTGTVDEVRARQPLFAQMLQGRRAGDAAAEAVRP